ncbi:MAG TPA: cyclomaltodextrinase N-terminal domain-containing protein, partial [Cyclobacteriaceae bacterium]|nr:cyclomaltodextrinase N-terminal domain-containing protein [Cyclobacteriaceae bacterium]
MFSKIFTTCIAAVLFSGAVCAQKQQLDIQRVEPPFWWVGMKGHELQILVYGKNIAAAHATLQYEGVEILRSEKTENPNYQFLYLNINPSAKAGSVPITFQQGKQKKIITYEL